MYKILMVILLMVPMVSTSFASEGLLDSLGDKVELNKTKTVRIRAKSEYECETTRKAALEKLRNIVLILKAGKCKNEQGWSAWINFY